MKGLPFGSCLTTCNPKDLLAIYQPVYWPFHSTETDVLRVPSYILQAADNGDVARLLLLALDATFGKVDRNILRRRLEIPYGVEGPSLAWFCSYLTDRLRIIRIFTRILPRSATSVDQRMSISSRPTTCFNLHLRRCLLDLVQQAQAEYEQTRQRCFDAPRANGGINCHLPRSG